VATRLDYREEDGCPLQGKVDLREFGVAVDVTQAYLNLMMAIRAGWNPLVFILARICL
jgi:hypothetical protein